MNTKLLANYAKCATYADVVVWEIDMFGVKHSLHISMNMHHPVQPVSNQLKGRNVLTHKSR